MSRWYFALAMIIPLGLLAQPVSSNYPLEDWDGARFTEYCEAYLDDPASTEGALCRGFVLGFVAGAIAVQESVAPTSEGSEFSDRAASTRVGSRLERLSLNALPWFCLSSDTTLNDIAISALDELNARPVADAAAVAAALRRALARALPCDPN